MDSFTGFVVLAAPAVANAQPTGILNDKYYVAGVLWDNTYTAGQKLKITADLRGNNTAGATVRFYTWEFVFLDSKFNELTSTTYGFMVPAGGVDQDADTLTYTVPATNPNSLYTGWIELYDNTTLVLPIKAIDFTLEGGGGGGGGIPD